MADARDHDVSVHPGRSSQVFLAVPDGPGPHPGVLVLHEIFGLNDDIRGIARRFADNGYAALAPDLFGAGLRPLCILRAFLDLRRRSGRAFEDLEAFRVWFAERPEVDGSRLGVVGFCMGGGFALMYAARRESGMGVAANFYGDVPSDVAELQEVCPVLGGFGGKDRIFGPQGERLERLLASLGKDHDVKIYPDAGHSFMNRHDSSAAVAWLGAVSPMAVGHDEAASEDSWRRMLAFLGRHVGRAAKR